LYLLIFDAGWSVCVCTCVYTHTQTQTVRGVLDVSPGVGTRHLEGSKNPGPEGLNLGICVFVYGYKVHTCKSMLEGRMRSWTDCFFSVTYF
jgi:hypothetical protein